MNHLFVNDRLNATQTISMDYTRSRILTIR